MSRAVEVLRDLRVAMLSRFENAALHDGPRDIFKTHTAVCGFDRNIQAALLGARTRGRCLIEAP